MSHREILDTIEQMLLKHRAVLSCINDLATAQKGACMGAIDALEKLRGLIVGDGAAERWEGIP